MNPVFFIKKTKITQIVFSVLISLALSFVLFCVALNAVPHEAERARTVNVFDNTVRLRVVANSDSDEDQALKLAVRNDIIGVAHEIFKDCTDIESAKSSENKNMDTLLRAARESVQKNGSDMPVSISFGVEKCPVRRYSSFTFPAGEYMTLRINLGASEGENWWCVMYPPLCVSAASNDVYADVMTFKNHGFDDEQIDYLLSSSEKEPEIRFALAGVLKKVLG